MKKSGKERIDFIRKVLLVAIVGVFLFNTGVFFYTYGGGFTGLSINSINETVTNTYKFSPLPSKVFFVAQAGVLLVFGILVKSKKSQAAVEFLSTYGWTILAAIAGVGMLMNFGLFDSENFANNEATVNAPFYVSSWNVQADTNTVNFELRNDGAEIYIINSVSIDIQEGADSCGSSGALGEINPGASVIATINCEGLEQGNRFEGYISMDYTKPGTSLDLTSTGSISDKIIGEGDVPCIPNPNCDGVCVDGCTVLQDPDCGCANGNGCCGIDCDEITDDDCEPEGLPISDCQELQDIKDYLDGDYYLTEDVDCSETLSWNHYDGDCGDLGQFTCDDAIGCNWFSGICYISEGFEPIGIIYGDRFTGTFNGQDYKITGLYINRPGETDVGLFRFADVGVDINNVGLEGVEINGFVGVGGLVGVNAGTITKSYITGDISGAASVGGLAGSNEGIIEKSYATGTVFGGNWVGGLVGNDQGTIKNSYSTGSVSGVNELGGLVGRGWGTIENSYSTGSVSGVPEFGDFVGGLVGKLFGTIKNSYSTGTVSGVYKVGCLIGSNDGNLANSYWYDTLPGTSPDHCYSEGDDGCTEAGSVSDFYDSNYDVYDGYSPEWDFGAIWQENDESYPTLR